MTKFSRVAPHEYTISARVRSGVLRCGIVSFLFGKYNLHIWHSSHCINIPTLLTCWVPNNDQVLGSTQRATPFLHVPHHYQHEVNETNHMHKIITIMKKWSGVPHLHAGGNGNQAIKLHRPNTAIRATLVSVAWGSQ